GFSVVFSISTGTKISFNWTRFKRSGGGILSPCFTRRGTLEAISGSTRTSLADFFCGVSELSKFDLVLMADVDGRGEEMATGVRGLEGASSTECESSSVELSSCESEIEALFES